MILFVLPPLLSSVDIISTFNLNNFEHFNDLKTQYPDKSVRFEYFLATCLYMDADINLGFFLKNKLYGGLNGKDNSSIDKHLEQFKFLRLLAILLDAAQNLQEKSHTGPVYTNVLTCL